MNEQNDGMMESNTSTSPQSSFLSVKSMEMQNERIKSSNMTNVVCKDQIHIKTLINSHRLCLDASINANTIKNPKDSQQILHKKTDAKKDQEIILLNKNEIYVCYTVGHIFTMLQETCLRDFIIDCTNKFNGLKRNDGQRIAYQMARINKITSIPSVWAVRKMASVDWLQGFEARHMDVMIKKTDVLSCMKTPKFDRTKFFQELDVLKWTCGVGNGVTFYLDKNLKANIKVIPEMKVNVAKEKAVETKTLVTSNKCTKINNNTAKVKNVDENSFGNSCYELSPQINNNTAKVKTEDENSFDNSNVELSPQTDISNVTTVKTEPLAETDASQTVHIVPVEVDIKPEVDVANLTIVKTERPAEPEASHRTNCIIPDNIDGTIKQCKISRSGNSTPLPPQPVETISSLKEQIKQLQKQLEDNHKIHKQTLRRVKFKHLTVLQQRNETKNKLKEKDKQLKRVVLELNSKYLHIFKSKDEKIDRYSNMIKGKDVKIASLEATNRKLADKYDNMKLVFDDVRRDMLEMKGRCYVKSECDMDIIYVD